MPEALVTPGAEITSSPELSGVSAERAELGPKQEQFVL